MRSHSIKNVVALFSLAAGMLVGIGEPAKAPDKALSLYDGYAKTLANPLLDEEAPTDEVAVAPAELDHLNDEIVSLAKEYDPKAETLVVNKEDRLEPNYVKTSASEFVSAFEGEGTLEEKMAKLTNAKPVHLETLAAAPKYQYEEGPKNIHVMVHGLGGSASHWTNEGYNSLVTNGYLNEASLPYHIAAKYGTSVYVGKMIDEEAKLLKIGDYETTGISYSLADTNFLSYSEIALKNNDVIVYEDKIHNQASDDAFEAPYEKFNEAIYSKMNGGKFYLYGHSRGGLTNLQYVNAHNDMVAHVTSFGTPYYSPVVSQIRDWVSKWPSDVPSVFQYIKQALLKSSPDYASYDDLVNDPLLASYRKTYNELGNDVSKLDAYGFGYSVGYSTKVKILRWTVEIGYSVEIPFDALVGTYSAMGTNNGQTKIDMGKLGDLLGIPSFSYKADISNTLNVTRHKWMVNIAYAIDLYLRKSKRYLCNIPGADNNSDTAIYALALHNDEIMYEPVVEEVTEAA